jgi:hypothetical protein
MKIKDILLENDSLLSEASFLDWLKGKFTSDPIADKFRAAAARRNADAGSKLSTGQLAQSGGYAPTGSGRGDGNAEVAARAKRAKELERMQANAGLSSDGGKAAAADTGSSGVAKPSKDLDSIVFPSEKKLAQQKLDKYDDRAKRLARQAVAKPKKSAIVNPGAKAGQTPSAAGEFGSNKPRANIASTTNMSGAATNPQASAKFDQSKPTAVAKPAKKIGIQPGKTPSADTMDNRNK